MDLVPHIYHEKQEQGSMLCGQHALNNLLQSGLFTAPDLAEIARGLDALEASQLAAGNHLAGDSPWKTSQNYDDSGFFSVQVMEEALKVWGLRLVRWGSEEMQHLHTYPEQVDGFLLNHQLHWFSIRRFGTHERFYNLDSCISQPQWVSPMLLGLTLREQEKQGYSIFAIVPLPDSGSSGFPPCQADQIALMLPPPRGGGGTASGPAPFGAFNGTGYSLNGGNGAHAGPSQHSDSGGSGPFSTSNPYLNGTASGSGSGSAVRKGKRAASPDAGLASGNGTNDDDDDEIIIEDSGGSSTVDSESEKRRRRRRIDEPRAGGGAPGGSSAQGQGSGMSEEDQMAAAIAASLRVSGTGTSPGVNGSGMSTSATAGSKTPGRAALSEEEEMERAIRASLAEAGVDANGQGAPDATGNATESEGSQEPEGEDSPTMEELRRRRLMRFGM